MAQERALRLQFPSWCYLYSIVPWGHRFPGAPVDLVQLDALWLPTALTNCCFSSDSPSLWAESRDVFPEAFRVSCFVSSLTQTPYPGSPGISNILLACLFSFWWCGGVDSRKCFLPFVTPVVVSKEVQYFVWL